MDNLSIKVLKNIVTDAGGVFLQGGVQFFSDPNGPWPEGVTIPTVNLSRKGDNPNCDTPINSLEIHNGHSPTFKTQGEMDAYIERVVKAVDAVADSYKAWPPVQLPGHLKEAISDIEGLDNL